MVKSLIIISIIVYALYKFIMSFGDGRPWWDLFK
jgi:hypothetical protein